MCAAYSARSLAAESRVAGRARLLTSTEKSHGPGVRARKGVDGETPTPLNVEKRDKYGSLARGRLCGVRNSDMSAAETKGEGAAPEVTGNRVGEEVTLATGTDASAEDAVAFGMATGFAASRLA